MEVISEDERESKSSGKPVLKHTLWTRLNALNWTTILGFLSKEDIIEFCAFSRRLGKNYVLEPDLFKMAFVEYFGLHPIDESRPE
jgi:hypothetical protein